MKSRTGRALLITASLAALSAAAVAGCGWPADDGRRGVDAAPDGASAACAKVMSRLPSSVLGAPRRATKGAGTAAWGSSSIVLRCGVAPPAPTVAPCLSVNGVDWVLDERRFDREHVRSLTTYGRDPAVEVTFFAAADSAGDGVAALDEAVRGLPRTSSCL
ncbi:DUF3515 family protein [Streptomyces sp. URMC 123]|uniref:DUF3515 family protein n=1 Tax=Streptomyces sp. URMC 123 TaxID=3423403 RepID=UPI003F1A8DA4